MSFSGSIEKERVPEMKDVEGSIHRPLQLGLVTMSLNQAKTELFVSERV